MKNRSVIFAPWFNDAVFAFAIIYLMIMGFPARLSYYLLTMVLIALIARIVRTILNR